MYQVPKEKEARQNAALGEATPVIRSSHTIRKRNEMEPWGSGHRAKVLLRRKGSSRAQHEKTLNGRGILS